MMDSVRRLSDDPSNAVVSEGAPSVRDSARDSVRDSACVLPSLLYELTANLCEILRKPQTDLKTGHNSKAPVFTGFEKCRFWS